MKTKKQKIGTTAINLSHEDAMKLVNSIMTKKLCYQEARELSIILADYVRLAKVTREVAQ